jgi:hypothetical protein
MGKGRRIMKVVLLSIAGVIGMLVLAIAGLLIYKSIDKEDAFVLENAEFQEVGYLRRFEAWEQAKVHPWDGPFPVYAHRLKRGTGTIFAWRFYSNGEVSVIDDESYRKVTLWIAGPPPTATAKITLGDESKAVLISCDGGSAWPGRECCGYGSAGTVTITPSGSHFTIAVESDITPTRSEKRNCPKDRVEKTFTAKRIAFEDLTPWLGLAGPHPYSETYR